MPCRPPKAVSCSAFWSAEPRWGFSASLLVTAPTFPERQMEDGSRAPEPEPARSDPGRSPAGRSEAGCLLTAGRKQPGGGTTPNKEKPPRVRVRTLALNLGVKRACWRGALYFTPTETPHPRGLCLHEAWRSENDYQVSHQNQDAYHSALAACLQFAPS